MTNNNNSKPAAKIAVSVIPPPKAHVPKSMMKQKAKKHMREATPKLGSIPAARTSVLETSFKIKNALKHGPGAIEIHGTDFITQVTWNSGNVVGQNLFNFLLNPGDAIFTGTRLSQYALLYEKFIFKNFTIHADPQSGTSNSGSYLLAYDRDVSDNTPTQDANGIKTYFALMGTKTTQVFNRLSIKCPLADTQDFYYCNQQVAGAEERLAYQGQVYGAVVSPCAQSTSLNIWITYDVVFFDPTLESVASAEGAVGQTSSTTNSATNTGFNDITNAVAPVGSTLKFSKDTAGNSNFGLPSGYWLCEQICQGAGAALTIGAPSITSVIPSQFVNVTLTNLQNYASSAAGQTAYRLDRIFIPSGGGNIWSNLSAATTLAAHYVRFIKGASNWA